MRTEICTRMTSGACVAPALANASTSLTSSTTMMATDEVLHALAPHLPSKGRRLASRVLRLPIVTFYKTTCVAPYGYEAAAEEARVVATAATAEAGRGGRAPAA